MNKSVLIGMVTGVGVAVAGGVAAFSLIGQPASDEELNGAQADTAFVEEAPAAARAQAQSAAPQASVAAPVAAKVQAPKPATQTSTSAPAAAPSVAQNTVAAETCWEEEVEVPAEAADDKAIAGTATGAVVGGALAKKIGDDNKLVTAAGAAAGAFFGRKAQREFQENRTTTTTVTRCAPQ